MTAASLRDLAAGLALSLVCASTLAAELGGRSPWLTWTGAGALLVYFLLLAALIPRAGRLFFAAAALLFGWIAWLEGPALPALERGLADARLFVTLFVALGTLRIAAESSRAIRTSGRHLLDQPAGIRYGALVTGANFFALVLGFGVLNIVGSMIAKGLAALGLPPDQAGRRGRSAYVALVRGFCTQVAWSPIGLPMAIIVKSVSGAAWQDILPLGIAAALGIALLGWLEDLWRGRAAGGSAGAPPQTPARRNAWAAHGLVLAVVATVIAGAILAEQGLGVRIAVGAMLAAPLVALVWLIGQRRRFGARRALAATARRGAAMVRRRLAGYRVELSILVGASLFGAALAALIPNDEIAGLIHAAGLPPALLPGLVMALMIGTAQLGLNPIASTLIVVAAFADPAAFGVPPAVLGMSIMVGWSLAVGSSPFSITMLTVGSLARQSPVTVGQRWNGAFTLAALALAMGWAALLVPA